MTYTILFVDESISLHRIVQLSLKKEGYRVITTRCTEEALTKVNQEAIDVIFIDRAIQGPNFSVLIKKLNQQGVSTVLMFNPLFALTEDEIHDSSATATLAKPFSKKMLLATLQQVLNHQNKKSLSTEKAVIPEEKPSPLEQEVKAIKSHQELPPSRESIFSLQKFSDLDQEKLKLIAKNVIEEVAWEILPEYLEKIINKMAVLSTEKNREN